jgi:hypothetical protein
MENVIGKNSHLFGIVIKKNNYTKEILIAPGWPDSPQLAGSTPKVPPCPVEGTDTAGRSYSPTIY